MGNVVSLIINALTNSLTGVYVCKRISKYKINFKKPSLYFCFILLNVFLFFNYYSSNAYVKVLISTLLLVFFLRITFIKDTRVSIVTTLMFQMIIFISELVVSISLLLIFHDNIELVTNHYFGSLVPSMLVSLIAIFLSGRKIFKAIYKKLLDITNNMKISGLIFIAFILMISVNLFLAISYYKTDVIIVLIINVIFLIVYSFIVYKFIQQKNRYIVINNKYSMTESSLKELQNNVNRLMTLNHENKNQLVTIRTMIANKDKNVLKNIDAMIDRKIKDDKELKERTSVIANTMIGALIYSKMLTMKEKQIHYDLHIEKTISKIEFINLGEKNNVDICKVIGVYLDNAIEATLETKEKDISIQIYLDEDNLVICIANTFSGDVDLSSIEQYGYTTKSEGHGFGLSLVKQILKENNSLSSDTEVSNNIFMQNLKIKM